MAGTESPGDVRDTRYEPPPCGRCKGMGYESGLNASEVCDDCDGTGIDIDALISTVRTMKTALREWADSLKRDASLQWTLAQNGGDDYGDADEYRAEGNRNETTADRLLEIAQTGDEFDLGDRCRKCHYWFWPEDGLWHSLIPKQLADDPDAGALTCICPLCITVPGKPIPPVAPGSQRV